MHFCGSVITHYDTFSLRLQSAVGSPEGLSEGDYGSCGSRSGLRSNKESHRPVRAIGPTQTRLPMVCSSCNL